MRPGETGNFADSAAGRRLLAQFDVSLVIVERPTYPLIEMVDIELVQSLICLSFASSQHVPQDSKVDADEAQFEKYKA